MDTPEKSILGKGKGQARVWRRLRNTKDTREPEWRGSQRGDGPVTHWVGSGSQAESEGKPLGGSEQTRSDQASGLKGFQSGGKGQGQGRKAS